MVEIDRRYETNNLMTSEFQKEWTEKSPKSKLNSIKRIFNNRRLDNIPEAKAMKDKLLNREYREVQRLAWMKIKECDWKLGPNSLAHIGNYINKLKSSNRITSSTNSEIWNLMQDVWEIQNMNDTIQIQHAEQQYLKIHGTMDDNEFKALFSWRERLQQWQFWDCYLVSAINELSRAQHFDTLMRTWFQRVMRTDDWSYWYQIKVPLWEPSWRKIFIKDEELRVAKIQWNDGYKFLELAYAKNKLRPNNKAWNKYAPITESEFAKIKWWWTKEVLETFLWKHNISFNTFWDDRREKPLSQISQAERNNILWFFKNYHPGIWNKFLSLSSIYGSDTQWYQVWNNTIYHWHAYSVTKVNKDPEWNVLSINVLNPWNDPTWKRQWRQKQTFTIDEFFQSFSYMSYWQIKTNTFLDNKGIPS